MPQEVVPGHFRKPKTDRLLAEEVIPVEEGTSVAAGEAAPERMDCFVDSTQPELPCLDLLEGVLPVVN